MKRKKSKLKNENKCKRNMKEKENTNFKNKKLSWRKIECRLKTEN